MKQSDLKQKSQNFTKVMDEVTAKIQMMAKKSGNANLLNIMQNNSSKCKCAVMKIFVSVSKRHLFNLASSLIANCTFINKSQDFWRKKDKLGRDKALMLAFDAIDLAFEHLVKCEKHPECRSRVLVLPKLE